MTTVLGYDPSTRLGGWAVTIDDVPHAIGVWRPSRSSLHVNWRLVEWDLYCGLLMASFRPDVCVMEFISVSTSHGTTRSLSRFESAFVIRSLTAGARLIEYKASQGRAAFFGEGLGSLPRREAYAAMRARYPALDWLPADGTRPGDERGGGLDQADALVPALSWREIERRQAVVVEQRKAANKRKRAAREKTPT